MLNEDLRFMLDMNFNGRDAPELERLKFGACWPLVVEDVDDCAAYRAAAARAWADAAGDAL